MMSFLRGIELLQHDKDQASVTTSGIIGEINRMFFLFFKILFLSI